MPGGGEGVAATEPVSANLVPPQSGPEPLRGAVVKPELAFRIEAGRRWPLHVWRFDRPLRAISCGPYGGGLGERLWVLNASVPRDYARRDPDVHVAELAAELGLTGPGAGMLTAVDVAHAAAATDGGVSVVATVGLGYPTRAAAPEAAEVDGPVRTVDTPTVSVQAVIVGTINIVAFLPVPLLDAALVNAVATATEAKVQALADCGFSATGTATDALFLACPVAVAGAAQPYGGPRSTWGARLARAVHAAVGAGTRGWQAARRDAEPGKPGA